MNAALAITKPSLIVGLDAAGRSPREIALALRDMDCSEEEVHLTLAVARLLSPRRVTLDPTATVARYLLTSDHAVTCSRCGVTFWPASAEWPWAGVELRQRFDAHECSGVLDLLEGVRR